MLRILWSFGQVVFRLTPRPMFRLRAALLRLFGARIGSNVNIYNSVRVIMPWNLVIGDWVAIGEEVLIYNLGRVTIGDRASISHRAHLCAGTHDYASPALPLQRPPITIGADSWVCADAFIGPGVRIGRGAVTGARAVVLKNVNPWTVVGGNPARHIKRRVLQSGGQ